MGDAPGVPLLPCRLRVGAAVAVAVALVGGSLVPGGGAVPAGDPLAVGADKWLHAAGYAVLTATVAYALVGADGDRHRTVTVALVALAVAVALGAVVELAQTAVPGRGFDRADLLANAVGAATAAVLWTAVTRRVRFRPRPG